ncbi:MAG TPA: DUF3592 domain-containing protein [Cyclobacteriaceae bacterium]|nr:DUF3592 domain-containing protein [Cyclobacteriaceae bacterium]HMV09268.1 DUF3592 domain-containing protein [Cyclobacteriaceae bacterium]HMV91255.1 DUF3592 domain-containing protein [Cyclobacteriaceae bacterium]HMX01932.1 DUF3592 domain-containing protein [Cyclobacteriaceae bacterium]HMX50855.1 DUF3592 domain-containing protein [Cyclobacteriaceae bacterium]
MYKLASRIIYLGAVITGALALLFYLRFQGAKLQWDRTNAIVTSVKKLPPDSSQQTVTLQYTINNTSYTSQDAVAEFNHQAGDTLVLLVNPEDSSDLSLLESEGYMNGLALKTAAWSVALFAAGFLLARQQK